MLKQAETGADEKIAELQQAKERIRRARMHYESKLNAEQPAQNGFVKELPQRVLLLSETLEEPTVENLWDYHRHFYGQLPKDLQSAFAFEDQAGIYEQGGRRRLFAVCTRYAQTDGLVVLPAGRYLCADCTEETLSETLRALKERAAKDAAPPAFTLRFIVISGIARWRYRLEVPYLPQ